MIIFLVHTIKELANGTINTDFVIEAENETVIKEFMSQHKVILLGITKVAGRPNSGQYYGLFQQTQNTSLKFCIKSESLESACERCIDLGLPLIDINDISKPVNTTEVQSLIQSLINKKQNIIQEQKAVEEVEKKKKKEIMDDKRKEKIMSVIGDTLNDIATIEKTQEGNITFLDKKRKLRDLKEQLTKIKMGSNLEKATTVLEETFALMELIEIDSLTQLKEEEQRIMSSSIISNIDIISELDKIKRANQTTQAGTKKNSSDLYYTYLGIAGLYQKFILKDVINKLSELKNVVSSGIEYIGFGLVVMCSLLGGFLYYHLINKSINEQLFLTMISLGVLSLIRELPLAVKKSGFIFNIIYIVLAIIISIVIQKLLIINFALV